MKLNIYMDDIDIKLGKKKNTYITNAKEQLSQTQNFTYTHST